MGINEKDVKKLWGLAAGRCSYPGCDEECIKFLSTSDSTIIGEMAHVVAQSPKGPRGNKSGGDDSYENLVLLCPTHHTLVDKAPEGYFSIETLLKWKKDHEAEVRRTFLSPIYKDKKKLCGTIKRLLIENHQVWLRYGPDSEVAKKDPISNIVDIWSLRKLDTIVPNNRKIVNLLNNNKALFSFEEYETCCMFIEHAEGFEANCYWRRDSVPRFPKKFQEIIDNNV